jgi:predicted RNA methylase
MTTTESRSSQSLDNLQELLDAGQVGDTSLEQYETPAELANELINKLPTNHPATIFDPQCGSGRLVNCANGWPMKYGIEIDNNKSPGGFQLITGNCMKVFEAVEELMPDLRFVMANANPPFGIRWKMRSGKMIDSTLATWRFVTQHANQGFFIANASTIEKLELHLSTDNVEVTFYERRQALKYWKGLRPELEIGVLCWQRKNVNSVESWEAGRFTPPGVLQAFWQKLSKIIDEEKVKRPDFNIWLDEKGFLKTYLSQRNTFKLKLTQQQILKLHRLNETHPLTLTTEKETRTLLRELIDCGLYTIQPAAQQAIENALAEVNALACPIMPVNDFETVAYTEEEDALVCHKSFNGMAGQVAVALTAGKSYPLTTGSYKFTESFKRNKVHFNEQTQETYTKEHDCVLSGSDRFIAITDDHGNQLKFMDRPRGSYQNELPETSLWKYFNKPVVNTVAENCREQVNTNTAVLKACEMLAGYEYYEGQLNYTARVAVKDAALIAAETGVGKSLLAISLLAMKSPQRALIIAPQGSMRASKVDEDDDSEESESMSASQWLKELNKFAPYLQVWEIFSYEDYLRILALNNGELPYGCYVTYYEAFFSNGAREKAPASWDDTKLNKWAKSNGLGQLPIAKDSLGAVNKFFHCDSIGKEVKGVRCIIEPCLSTLIGDKFDCVIVDESHRCFPGDVKVMTDRGLVRIGDIVKQRTDVKVLSCNTASGVLEWKNVTAFHKYDDARLVKVQHEHGEIICTPDHEIYTQEGKVAARDLSHRHSVKLYMPSLWKSSISRSEQDWQEPLLQHSLQGDTYHVKAGTQGAKSAMRGKVWAADNQVCSSGSPSSNDNKQPDAKSENSCQDAMLKKGTNIPFSRRKRKADCVPNSISQSARMENGTYHQNAKGTRKVSVTSEPLQRRYCQSENQTLNRGGREHSQVEKMEVSRQAENGNLVLSRVVSVEVLERRNHARHASSSRKSEGVYCLEVEDNHNFIADGVLVSNCKGLSANVTQMLIRLQPKYRYCLSATPVSNVVSDLFPIMGWLAVPDWYKGDRRNAAWPYAREDLARFNSTFLTQERDLTQEESNRKKDPKNKTPCVKDSPIISSPARLLKLIKPNLAFISKAECRADYIPPNIIDVRVPLGREQAVLYGHFTDRANISATNALVRARKQTAYLRNICADPAGFTHGGPKVLSNFNPKVLAILELTRDILDRGEQVVIINSRIGLTSTIATKLAEAGVPLARIDSTMDAEQHSYQANLFKSGKARVLCMGIKCANAFSFDTCENLIIGSLEYAYGHFNQACGRIDRITNKVKKNIYVILHRNSLEEIMFDTVAIKGDAAALCLRGKRVPRGFKPVDGSEILANAIDRFDLSGSKPESECEQKWPKLRNAIQISLTNCKHV